MRAKNQSSKVMRSIGFIASISLIAGFFTASPAVAETLPSEDQIGSSTIETGAPDQSVGLQDQEPIVAVESNQDQGDFSITATRTLFYTDDETPQISVDKSSLPDSLVSYDRTKYAFYLVDLMTQSTVYSSDVDISQKIARFSDGSSRSFKIIVAKVIGWGGISVPVSQLTDIIAESNVLAVTSAKWEIEAWGPVDHLSYPKTGAYQEPTKIGISWSLNQPIFRPSYVYGNGDSNFGYTVYTENVDSGEVKSYYPGIATSDVSSGDSWGFTLSEEETGRFKSYVASGYEMVDGKPQFQNVQAASEEIIIPPRKWGVQIGSYTIQSYPTPDYPMMLVRVPFSSTRSIKASPNYTLYIEDVATGKIVCADSQPENEGRTWVHCIVPGNFGDSALRAYVAQSSDTGIQHVSQLTNIKAVSDQAYPIDEALSDREKYIRSGMFQNGSNPSTADCEQQCYGDPINALNGELFENDVDLQIEGAIGLNFTRSFSSLRSYTGAFGPGTTFSYDMGLRGNSSSLADSDYITVRQENGSTVAFAVGDDATGGKRFSAPVSVRASLSIGSDGNYIFTRQKTQEKFIFNSATGGLVKILDRLGNEISLNYTNNRLTSVSNGTSSIAIEWNGSLIDRISSGPHSVGYSYTDGRLTSVSNSKFGASKNYSYNSDGQLKTITHPNGGSYETTYDAQGRAVAQIDPRGGTTNFEYQANGVTLITLPNGDKTQESYDGQGRLIGRVLAFGTPSAKSYSYTYQSSGEMTSEISPGNRTTKYRYDARGNLIHLTNPASEIYRFEYNSANQLLRTTDPLSRTSSNEYDSQGRLLKSVNFDGSVTTYEHNAKGMLTAVKDPLGQASGLQSSYIYNGSDLLSGTTDTQGNITNYSYNAARSVSKITDPLGNETSFSYLRNNRDLVSEIIYADGATESYSYDAAGRKLTATAKDGTITSYSYDAMDNLLTETTAHGTTSYEYDQNQKLVATINPKGARTEYEYNAFGLVTKEKLPGNRSVSKEYSIEGLLSAQIDGNGNRTSYGYTDAGRLSTTTYPDGSLSQLSYDKLGNIVQRTTPSGNWIRYSYDRLGRLTLKNEKDLRKTLYSYDANGNLTKTTYGDGTKEQRSYDSEDRLIQTTGRDGKTNSYSYDSLGRLTTEVRSDGSQIQNSYDSVGNLISSDYGAGHIYEKSYNLKGQLVEATAPGADTIEYAYSPAGELTSRGPPSKKVGYSYNSYGEIETISYPSGLEIGYGYDELGNLKEVTKADEILAVYSYDKNFNLTRSSYSNDSLERAQFDKLNRLIGIKLFYDSGESFERKIQYNLDSQLSNGVTTHSGSFRQNRSYSYSPLSVVSSVKNELTAKTENFSYDLVNNIRSLGTGNYSYNGASGETTTSNTPAGGARSYSYDGRGNRTELSGSDGVSADYSWSKSNELQSVELTDLDRTIDYSYDAEGLLASRSVAGGTEELFSWDTASGPIPILLEDGDYEYIYGADATPFLQIEKGTEARTYLYGDERNSVVAAADSTGSVLWHRDYDEYGSKFTETTVSGAAGSVKTRFGYAGEYLDEDTGLYNLRARWYDPHTAAFLSVDPALNLTGEKYSYASGNPLSYTDPLGLWSMKDTSTSFAAVVDGFIGFPAAASLMNSISPGSVDNCSALYMGVGAIATVGSLFIPGLGAVKGVSLAAKGIGKVAQVAGSKKFVSNIKSAFPRSSHPDSGELFIGGNTRVGRWMSPDEHRKMESTGRLQEPADGASFVSKPPSHDSFKSAKPGSRYVEFDIADSALSRAGSNDWRRVNGPNSMHARIGKGLSEMPEVSGIEWVASKWR